MLRKTTFCLRPQEQRSRLKARGESEALTMKAGTLANKLANKLNPIRAGMKGDIQVKVGGLLGPHFPKPPDDYTHEIFRVH